MRLVERGFKKSLSHPEGDSGVGTSLETVGMVSKVIGINTGVIYWMAATLRPLIDMPCSAQHPEDGRMHNAEGP